MLENLNKRFSKKRVALSKSSRSGSGRSDVAVTVEKQMKKYGFFFLPCTMHKAAESEKQFPRN